MSNSIITISPHRREIPAELMPLAFPTHKPKTIQNGKEWTAKTKPNFFQQTSPVRAISEFVGGIGFASFFLPSKDHILSSFLTAGGVIGTIITWALEPDLNPDRFDDLNKPLTPDSTGTEISDPTKSPKDRTRVPTSPGATRIPRSGGDTTALSLEELIKTVKKKSNGINIRIKAADEIIKRFSGITVDQKEQVVEAFIYTLGNGQAANDKSDKVRKHIVDQFNIFTTEPTEKVVRLLVNSLEANSIESFFKTKIAYRIADIDKTKLVLSPPTVRELKTKFDSLREKIEAKIVLTPINDEAAALIPTLTASLLKKDQIEDQELPKHIALLSISLAVLSYNETKEEILPK